MIIKKVSKKEGFIKLLAMVAKEWDVYAPFEEERGDIAIDKLEPEGEGFKQKLRLDVDLTLRTFKQTVFPQSEKILSFKGDKVEEHIDKRKRIFFGIRSCDASAMLFTDDFFKRDYEDIYYLTRSENRLMINIGCDKKCEKGFCVEAGTGPYLKEGFDIQLTEYNGGYLVEVASDKGKKFVEDYANYFEEATVEEHKEIRAIQEKGAKACNTELGFKIAVEKLRKDLVPQNELERITKKCISCGACLYNCPTCTCFNVYDNTEDGTHTRHRNWDGCVFKGYTSEASGHNPRANMNIRTGRRYEHKLKYDYGVNHRFGCVGCGRCLAYCPVELGIEQVIEKVAGLK